MKPRVKAGKVAPMSVEAAEAKELQSKMQAGQIPSITVDMDKACKKCGTMGATESGLCLACVSKKVLPEDNGESEPKKKKAKPVQMEATALIPKLDGVGKAANRMAEAIKLCDEAAEEKGEAESNLIAALRRAKRTSIKVSGYGFNLSHIGPKDKIVVQKPK